MVGAKVEQTILPRACSLDGPGCHAAQPVVVPGSRWEARRSESSCQGVPPAILLRWRRSMDVIHTHCAGLDVHKKSVVVCCITPSSQSAKSIEQRTFGTMTADILAMSDWLTSQQITHVAMESTGEFWKPIYNLLEGHFELLVVSAKKRARTQDRCARCRMAGRSATSRAAAW
ncbi:MAG: hypothetical protein DCC55_32955 [Chloroflexi bacterium]|nr:MAG: hypothetical protein DCC55_32955 [Chloroflexota bacterium]